MKIARRARGHGGEHNARFGRNGQGNAARTVVDSANVAPRAQRDRPRPGARASVTSPPEWRLPSSSSIARWALTSGTSTAASTSTSRAASGVRTPATAFPTAVAAIHEQVDRYLHQCFMVGMYEPYVEVCRRLAELSPCRGDEQKSLLVNSGAEAIENAVKIARVATGRPAVVVFDRAFHGRTLLSMTMTSKVVPYKRGFGPFAPEVYRAPAPYPYRGVTSDDAIHGLEALFKGDVDPAVGRLRRPRAGAGRGRLHSRCRTTFRRD